jgi:hypothetical protein
LYLKSMINRQFYGFYRGILPDSRIEKRAEKVMADMLTFGNVVVNKFCATDTKKKGAYRMLNNDSFDHDDLAEGLYRSCKNNDEAVHLLCIQDTTEINFTDHINRIRKEDDDIGPVTREDNIGFFCHPVLVVNPVYHLPIGISHVNIWNRRWDKLTKNERDYKNQDIKDKESYRWIKSAKETKDVLTKATCITFIGDRESDIYDEFVEVPDNRTHLLIRSNINRTLYGDDKKLFEKLDSSEQRVSYELDIRHNQKRETRKAKMSLKYEKVKISCPQRKELRNKQAYVEMWAIEAKELPETVPVNETPILWRLLTTHKISSQQDAFRCVDWYSQRWFIEELFRVIKSKGLMIESAQLEKGEGLKKLAVMSLQVALTTMVLKLSLTNDQEVNASLIFSKEQLDFLRIYMPELEGKTQKQKNPFKESTLPWAAWAIGRIGCWGGYISQGPPGYITIKTGLDRFFELFNGFVMAIKYLKIKDVYKE